MAKIRKYALIALAIVAFLTLMFLLYKGTQRNEATPGRTATPSVSTSSAPASSAPVQTPQVSEQSPQAAPAPEQPQQSQGAQDSPSESLRPPQRIRPNRRRALHLTLGRNNIKPMQQALPPVPVGLPAHPRGKNLHARRTSPISRWQMERLTAHSTIPRYA